MIRKISILVMVSVMILTACQIAKGEIKREIPYTVCCFDDIPQTLEEQMDIRKKQPFGISCTEDGWTYLAVGYGEKDKGGYCIRVEALYETENAIYIDTLLMVGEEGELKENISSFPVIVVKIKENQKPVVFQS